MLGMQDETEITEDKFRGQQGFDVCPGTKAAKNNHNERLGKSLILMRLMGWSFLVLGDDFLSYPKGQVCAIKRFAYSPAVIPKVDATAACAVIG